jgi:hypothetical protein
MEILAIMTTDIFNFHGQIMNIENHDLPGINQIGN